jgi:NTE family protein
MTSEVSRSLAAGDRPTADAELSRGSRDPIPRAAWLVLWVCAVGVFLVFLDATVVTVSFPAYARSFAQSSRGSLTWVLNAYSLAFGALLISAGRAADLRGRRRFFTSGLVVFALASLACAASTELWELVVARAVQGAAAAALLPSSLGLVLASFPESRRSTAVGLWGAVGGFAATLGPSAGALISEFGNWRYVFLINVPICCAALVAAKATLEPDGPKKLVTIDTLGGAELVAGMAALLLAVTYGPDWGWLSPRTVAAFCLAAAFLILFGRRSSSNPGAVIPVALLRNRLLTVTLLATGIAALAFYANLLNAVLFLTEVWHYSLVRTALSLLPAAILTAAASAPAGRMAERWGHRRVVITGLTLFAAGQVWFRLALDSTPDLRLLTVGVLAVGAGIGISLPTLSSAGAVTLPSALFSAGGAMVATSRQLGAAMGIGLLIAVLGDSPSLRIGDFRRSWLLLAAETVVALAIFTRYRMTTKPDQTATAA